MADQTTPKPRRAFAGLFAREKRKPLRKGWKSDLALGAAGIALGLGAAYFPWYIFHNQADFGIRAMKFEGIDASAPSAGLIPTLSATPPLSVSDLPIMELDLFATGNIPDDAADQPDIVLDQPFPGEAPTFRVIHATAGRAMIEDDTGIFVVQRGSILPDDSRVTAIEQRKGGWIVVTDNERVLELDP